MYKQLVSFAIASLMSEQSLPDIDYSLCVLQRHILNFGIWKNVIEKVSKNEKLTEYSEHFCAHEYFFFFILFWLRNWEISPYSAMRWIILPRLAQKTNKNVELRVGDVRSCKMLQLKIIARGFNLIIFYVRKSIDSNRWNIWLSLTSNDLLSTGLN